MLKASVNALTPNMLAIMTSRASPVMREASVQTATVEAAFMRFKVVGQKVDRGFGFFVVFVVFVANALRSVGNKASESSLRL
jgi:hypothetical protein